MYTFIWYERTIIYHFTLPIEINTVFLGLMLYTVFFRNDDFKPFSVVFCFLGACFIGVMSEKHIDGLDTPYYT